MIDEARDWEARPNLLAARVEILLAAADVQAALAAADELSDIAAGLGTPLLAAMAAFAGGIVLLADGAVMPALTELRRSWTLWQELEIPYEAARARVMIGLACREVGDEDSARLEPDAAALVFQWLSAGPDLARVEALRGGPRADPAGALTTREVQVLRLVASGKTNRAIAADLVISEKTVARHLSNIFRKLDLPSRAAATAYAYENRLR